jgi:hypothetical protein
MQPCQYRFIGLIFIATLFNLSGAFAQNSPQPIPFHRLSYLSYEKGLARTDKRTFGSFKPYREDEAAEWAVADSISNLPFKKWLGRKLFNEHFAIFEDSSRNWQVAIDPLMDLQLGKDQVSGTRTFTNTRGVQLMGHVGKKLSFQSAFYENQAQFVPYIRDFIILNDVVPGQAWARQLGTPTYDFSYVFGNISYAPNKYLQIQLGHDRNFIGDGYRSLLLSDASFAYPHLRIRGSLGPFQYHYILSQYTDLKSPVISQTLGKPYKYSSMSYLDWAVSNRLNIGIFQAVIWILQDSSGSRSVPWNYLNPLVFLKPIEFSTQSEGNMMSGLNIRYKVNSRNVLYGQLALDEFVGKQLRAQNGFYGNKYAIQLGYKAIEPFNVKNLQFQTEGNIVRPYTYSHWGSLTNYAQYNQPLAHPRGANFVEWVNLLDYRYQRYYGSMKAIFTKVGLDEEGKAWGQNVYTPFFQRVNDFDNTIGQGLKTDIRHIELQVGYVLNPRTNLRVYAGYLNRSFVNKKTDQQTSFFNIGMATMLRNVYFDF